MRDRLVLLLVLLLVVIATPVVPAGRPSATAASPARTMIAGQTATDVAALDRVLWTFFLKL